jgi:flavin reductase (DIM6/NTAB) family NADH-FMN oxidoreductase RutF/DNA-binding IclR family transcriptional regulator
MNTAASPAIDSAELRRCLGAFVTGVTVITTLDDEGRAYGMTANSFNSVSLDPPLIVWSIRTNASSFAVYSKARRFVVNILSEDQIDISNRFAKSGPDRFDGVATSPGIDGLPLIDACAAQLECRTEATYPGGDHLLFLGRVERIVGSARKPLAFGAGKYMVVHPYDSGAGSSHVASLNAVHLARPCLEDLNRETDRTVGLGVWGNQGPTLIWWIEAKRALDVRLRCGMVLPLLGSATGKVFAAFSSPALTGPYLAAEIAALQHLPAHPLASPEAVEQHLAQVRQRRLGVINDAIIADVNERGVTGVSAPVFDASGAIVLALTMMGDSAEFNDQDAAVAQLSAAARRLSARLGFHG